MLVSKGIFRWLHMVENGTLKPVQLIVGATGVGVTNKEYLRLQAVVGSGMHEHMPATLAGKSLRKAQQILTPAW
jgi:hypothetical protein